MIPVDEIECFYSENKGTYVGTTEGRNYLLDTTLENLEEELEPKTFFRVSRKFYININAIKDIISYTNSRLQIKLNNWNEQEIIVSRERVKDFKTWIDWFFKKTQDCFEIEIKIEVETETRSLRFSIASILDIRRKTHSFETLWFWILGLRYPKNTLDRFACGQLRS